MRNCGLLFVFSVVHLYASLTDFTEVVKSRATTQWHPAPVLLSGFSFLLVFFFFSVIYLLTVDSVLSVSLSLCLTPPWLYLHPRCLLLPSPMTSSEGRKPLPSPRTPLPRWTHVPAVTSEKNKIMGLVCASTSSLSCVSNVKNPSGVGGRCDCSLFGVWGWVCRYSVHFHSCCRWNSDSSFLFDVVGLFVDRKELLKCDICCRNVDSAVALCNKNPNESARSRCCN